MRNIALVVWAVSLVVGSALVAGACGDGSEGEPGANAEALTQAATEDAAALVPFAGPLAVTGRDSAGASDEPETHAAFEAAFDGSSCVAFDWSAASATLAFEECVLPQSGATVDGAMTLGVAVQPLRVTVGLEALRVDEATIDGSFALQFGDGAVALDADVSVVRGGQPATRLVLEGAQVSRTEGATTFDGDGTIEKNGSVSAVSFDSVTWQDGDCLPSSGTVTVQPDGSPPVIITFLPATPEDGVVSVKVGELPATDQALLPACP